MLHLTFLWLQDGAEKSSAHPQSTLINWCCNEGSLCSCPLHPPSVNSGLTPILALGLCLFLLCKGNFLGREKSLGVHSWTNRSSQHHPHHRAMANHSRKLAQGEKPGGKDEPPKGRGEHIPGAALLPGDPSCCSFCLVLHNSAQSLQDVFLGVPISLAWLC